MNEFDSSEIQIEPLSSSSLFKQTPLRAKRLSGRQSIFHSATALHDNQLKKTAWFDDIDVTDRSLLFKKYKMMFSRNHGWFYSTLLLLEIFIFLGYCNYYSTSTQFETMRSILSDSFAVARASAGALNVNCSLILLTMCRKIIDRAKDFRFLRRIIPFNDMIFFHQLVACYIWVFVVIHVTAHSVNFVRVSSAIPTISFRNLLFEQVAGLTGFIMVVILVLVTISSGVKAIRRWKFEVFYFIHWLIIPFYVLLLLHGSFCFIKYDSSDGNLKCLGASSWKFLLVPLLIFGIEKLHREYWARKNFATIHKLINHPSNVFELSLMHPNWFTENCWNYRPGQFLFLNCRDVSWLQWHPFTITSCPQESKLTVHVKASGNFTRKLRSQIMNAERAFDTAKNRYQLDLPLQKFLPRIHLDGPHWSPCVEIYSGYKTVLAIAGGIGVTPYASVLKSIHYAIKEGNKPGKLEKLYFIWICSDVESFQWFYDILDAIESHPVAAQMVDIALYWSAKNVIPDECRDIHENKYETTDKLTGLKTKTFFGRPRWESIFQQVGRRHAGQKIGTFLCGPESLKECIDKHCFHKTLQSSDGTEFEFHPETF